MKHFPGAQFIERVINLFRDDAVQSDHGRPNKDGTSSSTAGRTSKKGTPSTKARESNIDRYKHPSDFFRSGY